MPSNKHYAHPCEACTVATDLDLHTHSSKTAQYVDVYITCVVEAVIEKHETSSHAMAVGDFEEGFHVRDQFRWASEVVHAIDKHSQGLKPHRLALLMKNATLKVGKTSGG